MSRSNKPLNSKGMLIKYGVGAGVVLGAMGALTSTIIYYSSSKLFLDITTALYLNSLPAGLSILLITAAFAAIGVFSGIIIQRLRSPKHGIVQPDADADANRKQPENRFESEFGSDSDSEFDSDSEDNWGGLVSRRR